MMDAALEAMSKLREDEADYEVRQCKDGKHLKRLRQQVVIDLIRRKRQLLHADYIAETCFLDGRNELADDAREHVVKSLRKHNFSHRLEVCKSERTGSFDLSAWQRLDASTNDFSQIG